MRSPAYRLVVFDMDGVLVDVNSSWAWIHRHFGVNNDESLEAYIRGDIDDMEFMRRDIALWLEREPGLTREYLGDVLGKAPLMTGCRDCLCTLRRMGVKTGVISGGIRMMVEHIGPHLFDWVMANDVGPGMTGVLEVPLKDKGSSFRTLLELAGVPAEETVAVGNSFIDVPMLEEAGLGIAFNPEDDQVCGAADTVIRDKDLRHILSHVL